MLCNSVISVTQIEYYDVFPGLSGAGVDVNAPIVIYRAPMTKDNIIAFPALNDISTAVSKNDIVATQPINNIGITGALKHIIHLCQRSTQSN